MLFGLSPLSDLAGQVGVAAPSENDERNVEQQCIHQEQVRSEPLAGPSANEFRDDVRTGSDEEDDRRQGNAQCNHVALGGGDLGRTTGAAAAIGRRRWFGEPEFPHVHSAGPRGNAPKLPLSGSVGLPAGPVAACQCRRLGVERAAIGAGSLGCSEYRRRRVRGAPVGEVSPTGVFCVLAGLTR
jgi:hypothetical protein